MSAKSSSLPKKEIVHEICRVCMKKYEEMNYMFDEVFQNDIIDKIHYCTSVQITKTDDLTPLICDNCLRDLYVTYSFHKRIQNTDVYLRQHLNDRTEVLNSDCDDYLGNDEPFLQEIEELSVAKVENTKPLKKKVKVKKKNVKIKPQTKSPKKKKAAVLTNKYICETCNIKFRRKRDMTAHNAIKHKIKEEFICHHCGKVCKSSSTYSMHVKCHGAPDYECNECGYKTWFRTRLINHINTHNNTRPYQCHMCPHAANFLSNLKRHIQHAHGGVKTLSCTDCGKMFFGRTDLNKHMDTHIAAKRYKCDICDSRFSTRCHWKKHLFRQHSIELPKAKPGPPVGYSPPHKIDTDAFH